jgi:hypothetical protein
MVRQSPFANEEFLDRKTEFLAAPSGSCHDLSRERTMRLLGLADIDRR